MPPIYKNDRIYTGIHDFKTHIARYLRELDSGKYESLILTSRRGESIALFMSHKGNKIRQKQARLAELSGLLGGSGVDLAGLIAALKDGKIGGK